MKELKEVYKEAKNDPKFQEELKYYLKEYSGRETPLTYAENLTKHLGGAKIYLMGEKRLVAETGAGHHGVASATVATMFDMKLVVFMGQNDAERQ